MVYFYFLIMKSFYLLECGCVAIDIANHKIVITSANSILNYLFKQTFLKLNQLVQIFLLHVRNFHEVLTVFVE